MFMTIHSSKGFHVVGPTSDIIADEKAVSSLESDGVVRFGSYQDATYPGGNYQVRYYAVLFSGRFIDPELLKRVALAARQAIVTDKKNLIVEESYAIRKSELNGRHILFGYTTDPRAYFAWVAATPLNNQASNYAKIEPDGTVWYPPNPISGWGRGSRVVAPGSQYVVKSGWADDDAEGIVFYMIKPGT
jgi:hypothetical protein